MPASHPRRTGSSPLLDVAWAYFVGDGITGLAAGAFGHEARSPAATPPGPANRRTAIFDAT